MDDLQKHLYYFLITLLTFFWAATAHAQFEGAATVSIGGSCPAGWYAWPDTNGLAVVCTSGAWAEVSGGGLPSLTSAYIWVGNGSNVATAIAPSGDLTVSNAGAFTIGSGKVTNADLAGSIAASKLVGTDIATVGTITSGTWHGTAVDLGSYVSGNLAVSHLNSGTSASSSTFWRGDGSWAAIASPNVQVFTSSGTYTWSSSYTHIEVFICGGGGGGGGSTSGGSSGGSGGAGGACKEAVFTGSDIGGNVTVTIGAAGSAASGNSNGGAGGNTTFGAFLTAYGGGGGGANGGNGGSGGDLTAAGSAATSSANGFGGGGGTSGGNGNLPTSPYAGAGGASGGAANSTGGAGASGWLSGPGGGGGGGYSTGTGGAGGRSIGCATAPSGGSGSGTGGSTAAAYNYLPGCGGGGGGGNIGTGGAGTNAGGGGGAGGTSFTGAGGAGGKGFAVVRSW